MDINMRQYEYVYWGIVSEIYRGKIKKGDTLPALAEISQSYSVGRNTARSAVMLLEENGYVECSPRKKPTVCFDFENPKYRKQYLEELCRRRNVVVQVMEFMGDIIPDMVVRILALSPNEKRTGVYAYMEDIVRRLPEESETEMAGMLMDVYLKVISLGENELLNQLFMCLYYDIQVPITNEERQNVIYKAMMPAIRMVVKKMLKQAEAEAYEPLASQIKFFCQVMSKTIRRYLERILQGICPGEERMFQWRPFVEGRSVYMLLASGILDKISKGVYSGGDYLPSYFHLAEQERVSEKTIRTAIAQLNKLNIVSSINGVGTMVNPTDKYDVEILFQDEKMRATFKTYFEALYIWILMQRPVIMQGMAKMNGKEYRRLEEAAGHPYFNAGNMMEFMVEINQSEVVKEIYRQLREMLNWGYLLELFHKTSIDLGRDSSRQLVRMARDRKGDLLADEIYRIYKQVFDSEREFVGKYGIIIELEI